MTLQLAYMETTFFRWPLRPFQPETAKLRAQSRNRSCKNVLMKLLSLPLMRFQHAPRALLLLHLQTLLPPYKLPMYLCYGQAEIVMRMNLRANNRFLHHREKLDQDSLFSPVIL